MPPPSRGVRYGAELTVAEAVDRRRNGGDIVVRGGDKVNNRQVAQLIEAMVGPYMLHKPHAGDAALPHYQQTAGQPGGHAFYEVDHRKARRKS
jgi:hypothetical protein